MTTIGDNTDPFVPGPRVTIAGAAAGPLKGTRFAAKDLFDVAGHMTGAGNPAWGPTHGVAVATAPVISALLAAGSDLAGKTMTDEMACGLFGENAHYGTPLNPRHPDRVPGGSSSGSVSAVASGIVDFALGTDTGGSVRVPSAFCGVYGIRTSHGRVSVAGLNAMAPSFDTVGWFARDAEMLARVGAVILGPFEDAAPGKLLIAADAFATLPAKVAAVLHKAVAALSSAGRPPATEVEAWQGGRELCFETFRILQTSELHATLGPWVAAHKPPLGPGLAERFVQAATIGPDLIGPAMARRGTFIQYLSTLLVDDAILLLPTTHDVAPLKGQSVAELDRFRAGTLPLTCIAGLGRLPQLNLPVGTVDGCPVGLSMLAAHGRDALLLSAAKRFAHLWPSFD